VAVDLADPRPPYVQIAEDLRRKIRAGAYRAGDRLPSHKALAEEYDSAPETVRRALGVLRDEGLTATQSTRGTFVLRESTAPAPDREDVLSRLGGAEERGAVNAAAIAELRADVATLRAHVMNLYHAIGQPFPYEEDASSAGRQVG
jgi:GntR family transcriptional regulator